MAAGIGVDLGPVQADGAETADLVLAGDLQHLHKHRLELTREASAEIGQGVVVGMLITGDVTKCQ